MHADNGLSAFPCLTFIHRRVPRSAAKPEQKKRSLSSLARSPMQVLTLPTFMAARSCGTTARTAHRELLVANHGPHPSQPHLNPHESTPATFALLSSSYALLLEFVYFSPSVFSRYTFLREGKLLARLEWPALPPLIK